MKELKQFIESLTNLVEALRCLPSLHMVCITILALIVLICMVGL